MTAEQLKLKIDQKTKPLGALGMLEDLALQIGLILGTDRPVLTSPHLLVFAADHGIAKEGVSAYPQEVTQQMVLNFLSGGAAINVFCRQHDIRLQIIDAGVNADFDPSLPLLNKKLAKGTQSFLRGPAMLPAEALQCLEYGKNVVTDITATDCNVIGFGEMGIGNTSSAAVLMSMLCGLPLQDCMGRGTGLDHQQLREKEAILARAITRYSGNKELLSIMAYFGGFEILQITGAMLAAAESNLLILVDGFIATVAFLCAYKMNPELKKNAIFCHQSDEKGHALLLSVLGVRPVLHLGLRLGEGTGCALAYPLMQSAVHFLNDMASFETAAVSNKL